VLPALVGKPIEKYLRKKESLKRGYRAEAWKENDTREEDVST